MSRYIFQGTFRDGQGNIVSSGQIHVFNAGTTTASTIYADDTTTDVSPYVESDSNGYFYFYVDDGDYLAGQAFDIQLSKNGYTTKTFPDIVIFSTVSWVPVKSESATDFLDGTGSWDTIKESDLVLTDITTNNVSTSKHGFIKKLDNDATHFMDGQGVWDTVKDSDLALTDITTNDTSTTKHGFAPKLPNTATQFLNGIGGWSSPSGVPTGCGILWFSETPPTGFFETDGTAKNNTTYIDLLSVIGITFGRGTPISCAPEADDDTIVDVGHGLTNGKIVYFTASAMPTGLSSDTIYYIINATENTFKVSLTDGGDPVTFSTDGTTVVYYVDFKIPDSRGLFPRFWDHGAGIDPDAATRTDRGDGTTGDYVGTEQADEYKTHSHAGVVGTLLNGNVSTGAGGAIIGVQSNGTNYAIGYTGGNETRPVNINLMLCIKY